MYYLRYLEKPSKEFIARMLKKALALNGNRRYLIPDFPEEKEVYEEFKRIIGGEAIIRKIILLRKQSIKEVTSEEPKDTLEIDEDVKEIIKHLIKEGIVVQGDLAKPKEEIFSSLKG